MVRDTDFECVRTALGLFPSLKVLGAVVVMGGGSPRELSSRCLESRLLSEDKDWTAIETVAQGVRPFCVLRKGLEDSWDFIVVADWPGKVREHSFQIRLERQQ